MRVFGVVVGGTGRDQGSSVSQIAKYGLVEQFIAHAATEAFYETVDGGVKPDQRAAQK
jgi:hypothetical protein